MPDAAYLRLENRHTGEVLLLCRRRLDGDVGLELRGSLPPHREGPPMHVHYVEEEQGRVTAGRLSVEVDGRRIEAGPGEIVRFPKGVPHRWWNAADQPVAFEGHSRPLADLDRYLQAVFEVMNAGTSVRPPLFYLAHLALRHRRTQAALVIPRPLQMVLFPVVVAIGTLLGRYRGTDWPGCPSRCTGAPFAIVGSAS
jgi:mannose-6-phosphate isomerase-like protein (cupin superfamily)